MTNLNRPLQEVAHQLAYLFILLW